MSWTVVDKDGKPALSGLSVKMSAEMVARHWNENVSNKPDREGGKPYRVESEEVNMP